MTGAIMLLKRIGKPTRRVALFLLALLTAGPARADNTLEEAVKATYLDKLGEFVSWPPGAIPQNEFAICVVGHGPFGDLLDQAVRGQLVQGRPVVVRRYAKIAGNPGCQLMYVAGSNAQPIAVVLADERGAPVLTVTDGQINPASTGIINFVLVDGAIRFEVNRRAAAVNHLAISSKLLALAVREQ